MPQALLTRLRLIAICWIPVAAAIYVFDLLRQTREGLSDGAGRPFMCMKLVRGVSWGRILDPQTPVERQRASTCDFRWHLDVLRRVAEAVAYAHAEGVIHRDLKPSNIMIGDFGEVLVMDWGTALDLRKRDLLPEAERSAPSFVVGTPTFLSPEQATYHFLSGYTARVAGTEKGLTEPQATFSTCFGAPFMPRHPSVYAKMLGERIARHNAACWLVNTGWSGGAYGTGQRMKIAFPRAMVRAALDGKLASAPMQQEPHFGLMVPTSCPEVPCDVLLPRKTWRDPRAYDEAARDVARRFDANFRQFEPFVDERVKAAAIRAA